MSNNPPAFWRSVLSRAVRSTRFMIADINEDKHLFIADSQFSISILTHEMAMAVGKFGFKFYGNPPVVRVLVQVCFNEARDAVLFQPKLEGMPGSEIPLDLEKHREALKAIYAQSPRALQWPSLLQSIALEAEPYRVLARDFYPVPAGGV